MEEKTLFYMGFSYFDLIYFSNKMTYKLISLKMLYITKSISSPGATFFVVATMKLKFVSLIPGYLGNA